MMLDGEYHGWRIGVEDWSTFDWNVSDILGEFVADLLPYGIERNRMVGRFSDEGWESGSFYYDGETLSDLGQMLSTSLGSWDSAAYGIDGDRLVGYCQGGRCGEHHDRACG